MLVSTSRIKSKEMKKNFRKGNRNQKMGQDMMWYDMIWQDGAVIKKHFSTFTSEDKRSEVDYNIINTRLTRYVSVRERASEDSKECMNWPRNSSKQFFYFIFTYLGIFWIAVPSPIFSTIFQGIVLESYEAALQTRRCNATVFIVV